MRNNNNINSLYQNKILNATFAQISQITSLVHRINGSSSALRKSTDYELVLSNPLESE